MFEGLLEPAHLLLIAIIVIVFFGPSKLPEIGKNLGEAISGFREAMKHQDEDKS